MQNALQHIKKECDFIVSETKNKSRKELTLNPSLSRAAIWSLEIISEASKKFNSDFSKQFPKTNWEKLAGMKENLFSDSMLIDYEIVCDVIFNEIPALQKQLT